MILQHDVFWTGGSSWGPGTNASEHPWLSRGRQLLIIGGHHHTVPQVTRQTQTHFSQATGFTGPGQLEISWKNQPSDLHTRLVSCDTQKQCTATGLVSCDPQKDWSLVTLRNCTATGLVSCDPQKQCTSTGLVSERLVSCDPQKQCTATGLVSCDPQKQCTADGLNCCNSCASQQSATGVLADLVPCAHTACQRSVSQLTQTLVVTAVEGVSDSRCLEPLMKQYMQSVYPCVMHVTESLSLCLWLYSCRRGVG